MVLYPKIESAISGLICFTFPLVFLNEVKKPKYLGNKTQKIPALTR
jgi:hypothetical protein